MKELILEKIKQYKTIIIHRHILPDGDCMGSQIGLKEIIKASFPDKEVYAIGEESQQFYYVGRMDEIKTIKYQEALVIIVDVANKERISDVRFLRGKELIKIDHHPKREDVCDIEWIDTSYSSCCEMIVDFYNKNKNELKINENASKALFYGIVTDTNRFLNPTINDRTLYLASLILNNNININEIYQLIYNESLNITRLRGFVASNFTCTSNGLGYIKIDNKICKRYNVGAYISNVLVNTLGNTNEVKIWFVAIYDNITNRIRISLRSRELQINHIAIKYGGGGHKNASGIIVDNFYVVDKLIFDLEEYLKKSV